MASGSGPAAGLEKPDGPKNKKGRPFGSGKTKKRREDRASKQWSAMGQADPSDAEHALKAK